MKLETPDIQIQSNIETKKDIAFSLDNDSYILFDILRNKMYSDPIGSICREILANARDANREVGRDNIPVEITVPGKYMVIKDCGPGISPERMEDVYCVYGKSTKRNTDDQQGAFGLGAKTPFAYTDTFTIETVYNGIFYHYLAYIDETNIGKVKLIQKTKKEPDTSGTIIRVPVSPSDTYLFKERLIRFSMFWSVQPKFYGILAEEPPKQIFYGKNWTCYQNIAHNDIDVLVDDIPYTCRFVSCELSSFINQNQRQYRTILKFSTGEIDLSSNREQLHLNNKTKSAITKALTNYKTVIAKKIRNEIKQVPTFSKAIALIEAWNIPYDEWEWRQNRFVYPLKNPIDVFRINFKNKIKQEKHCNLTDISENSFIRLDKDKITSYDKRRIRQHLKDHGLRKVFILNGNENLPVTGPGLSTIKVKKTKKQKRATIKGYIQFPHKRSRRQEFDIDQKEETIFFVRKDESTYSRDLWRPNTTSPYHPSHWQNLPTSAKVVRFSEREAKYLGKNWISLTNYLDREIYKPLMEKDIQLVANLIESQRTWRTFQFLGKEFPKDFNFSIKTNAPHLLKYEKIIQFLIDNKKVTVEGTISEKIYQKYPMLRFCRRNYLDSKNQSIISNYVRSLYK